MLPTLADGDVLLVRGAAASVPAAPARDGSPSCGCRPDRPVAVKRLALRDDDGWWVERDHPTDGVDSWQLGRPVPDADLLGLVVLRLWPPPFRLPPARN